MIVLDRSALEVLLNHSVTDNIEMQVGVYAMKGELWEYVPPDTALQAGATYKAVLKLTNIGQEIDFGDVQLRVKKTGETLPVDLYQDLSQGPVERVDFPAIPELYCSDSGSRKPTNICFSVFFRPRAVALARI